MLKKSVQFNNDTILMLTMESKISLSVNIIPYFPILWIFCQATIYDFYTT
jgi:hypothetical protein